MTRSLGEASISPLVEIEIRAAELALLGAEFDAVEECGWMRRETIDLIVVDEDGEEHRDYGVPLNLDSPNWQAGWLAAEIVEHDRIR